MQGKVIKFDIASGTGYIEGYDESTYFFHENNVLNNRKLNRGDIVSFEYILDPNTNKLPYAVNIVAENFEQRDSVIQNDKELSKVYTEVFNILKYIPLSERNKIPKAVLNGIEANRDVNYYYKVQHIEDFENQEMLDETRAFLAILYRDYLASDEEKMEIYCEEKIELEKIDLENKNEYDKMFASRRQESKENVALDVKRKEGWFARFVNLLERFCMKKLQ